MLVRKEVVMDYEKIYKILMEIVADQNEVVIESKLKKKEVRNGGRETVRK